MFTGHHGNLPQTKGDWAIVIVMMGAVFGMFIAIIAVDFSMPKLTAAFCFLAWLPLLALHECAHAWTARALGWYVGRLVIGVGPVVAKTQRGDTAIEVRTIPLEGFVSCVPRNLRWPRLKNALIAFAGPGIELLLIAVLTWLIGFDRMFAPAPDALTAAAQGAAAAAAIGAFINLIPHTTAHSQGVIPNDGLAILQSFFLPREYFERQIGRRYNAEEEKWEEGG